MSAPTYSPPTAAYTALKCSTEDPTSSTPTAPVYVPPDDAPTYIPPDAPTYIPPDYDSSLLHPSAYSDDTEFVKPAPSYGSIPLEPHAHPSSAKSTVVQIQSNTTYKQPVFCCCCKRSPHIRCLIFTLLCIGSIVWCVLTQFMEQFMDYAFTGYIAISFTGIVYLCDCLFGVSSRYLWRTKAVESVCDYVTRIKGVAPAISISCECYHYETRTRYITETDSNGNTRTRTETYEEKVTTYTETQYFHYTRWDDISGNLTDEIISRRYLKVDYEKEWRSGDAHTKACWDFFVNDFNARNENKDTHYSWYTNLSIDGYCAKMLSVTHPKKKSFFLGWGWYMLFSLVLLSFPYRIWLEGLADYAFFTFAKRVYVE